MWMITINKRARKHVEALPANLKRKYQLWCSIVTNEGIEGLRLLEGARVPGSTGPDQSRHGFLDTLIVHKPIEIRHSRLNEHNRIFYEVYRSESRIKIIQAKGHDLEQESPVRTAQHHFAKDEVLATPVIYMSVGMQIRTLRELQDMTQASLAKRSGVDQASISNIERDVLPIGLIRARRIARALRVMPNVILFPFSKPGKMRKAASPRSRRRRT